jgi:hypothetical protein
MRDPNAYGCARRIALAQLIEINRHVIKLVEASVRVVDTEELKVSAVDIESCRSVVQVDPSQVIRQIALKCSCIESARFTALNGRPGEVPKRVLDLRREVIVRTVYEYAGSSGESGKCATERCECVGVPEVVAGVHNEVGLQLG